MINQRVALFSSILILIIGGLVRARAQDFAVDQLNKSPRHHEWVEVQANDRKVRSFVVYPEENKSTLAVLVIHENRGLTDWVRLFADRIAEEGYLAIAPDLLSEFDEDHNHTGSFENSDAARSAIYELDPKQVISDLKAVRRAIAENAASNGSVVVAGFCWGGSQSFRFATYEPQLKAVLTFYGSPPKAEARMKKIKAPVYGFYGGNDQRVNAKLPSAQKLMKKSKKFYDVKIYKGAGHAFMRKGDGPNASKADKNARDKAWKRIRKILKDLN